MSDPLSERLLSAVQTQLATIRKTAGYKTDAGQSVYRARRAVDVFPSIVIWEAEEIVSNRMDAMTGSQYTLSFNVEGWVPADQDETGRMLGLIRADIKICLMRWFYNGQAVDPEASASRVNKGFGSIEYQGSSPASREAGSDAEGVTTRFTATFVEKIGDPYVSD